MLTRAAAPRSPIALGPKRGHGACGQLRRHERLAVGIERRAAGDAESPRPAACCPRTKIVEPLQPRAGNASCNPAAPAAHRAPKDRGSRS